jgi:hypothetical protein
MFVSEDKVNVAGPVLSDPSNFKTELSQLTCLITGYNQKFLN